MVELRYLADWESFNDISPIPSWWKETCVKDYSFKPSTYPTVTVHRKVIEARFYDGPDDEVYQTPRDTIGHGTHEGPAGAVVSRASCYGLVEGTATIDSPGSRIAEDRDMIKRKIVLSDNEDGEYADYEKKGEMHSLEETGLILVDDMPRAVASTSPGVKAAASQTNDVKAPITTDSGAIATAYDYGAGEISTTGPL
ncbi:hypothetical protein GH714_016470 [Hevea brasiliensis]|uniref:Peptidase S8/S53 domain-containing protein n=1 Tax=Hevea brasiliensis TaxID=3981 RepID=A0A6A6NHS8_HEVBR|nr:hypothetical protein GH714_016470 [Hevea brasiliensis]